MTGDLVSLRVLIVSGVMPDRDTLRQGAGAVSVPIDILEAGSVKAALGLIAAGDIDIVFIDFRIGSADRAVVLTAIRSSKPPPFVFLFGAINEQDGISAADAKVDGLVSRPTSRNEAKLLLERCGLLRLPRRVLLVDDSATMRSIIRKILTASRFRLEVSEAEEGVSALSQMQGGKFDLVILDYHMPGLNGIETLSEIKRQFAEVAVVMITSTREEEITRKAQQVGALAILKKPFYPSDIDAVLHSVFGLGALARI